MQLWSGKHSQWNEYKPFQGGQNWKLRRTGWKPVSCYFIWFWPIRKNPICLSACSYICSCIHSASLSQRCWSEDLLMNSPPPSTIPFQPFITAHPLPYYIIVQWLWMMHQQSAALVTVVASGWRLIFPLLEQWVEKGPQMSGRVFLAIHRFTLVSVSS